MHQCHPPSFTFSVRAAIVTDGQGSSNHQTVPPWTSARDRRRWNEIDLWRFAIKWATVRKDERMSYSFHRKKNIYSIRSDKPLGFLPQIHREILCVRQATWQAPEREYVHKYLSIQADTHMNEMESFWLVIFIWNERRRAGRSNWNETCLPTGYFDRPVTIFLPKNFRCFDVICSTKILVKRSNEC